MTLPAWVQQELDGSHERYRTGRHDAAFTARQVAAAERVPPRRFAKVVIAFADARPVMLVLPADHEVDVARARVELGVGELRLADEHEMARLFPEAELGAVPPLPHWPAITIWADASLLHRGEIWFQGGTHEDAVAMDLATWRRWARPRVGDFARPLAKTDDRPGARWAW